MATKIKVTKTATEDPSKNGGGGKKPKDLTYDQINQWSDYVEANPGNDLVTLYEGFSKKNPGHNIDLESLRAGLDTLKKSTIRKVKEQVSSQGISGESVNTGYSFPRMYVDGKMAGRVNPYLQTKGTTQTGRDPNEFLPKYIPPDAQEVWFDQKENVVKYVDPKSGDIVRASVETMISPIVSKKIEQQMADWQARQSQVAAAKTTR